MPDGGLPGDATALRLRLLANGWVPVPITAPDHRHPEVKSPGKQPFLPRWQTFTRETLDEATVRGWARPADQPGTGLVCGRLVVADLDAPVEEVAERLKATAFALLGPSPFVRVGRAPKLALCYRVDEPVTKMLTPELFLGDGTKLQVEVLGAGQQVVGYGIHPDTGRPYAWPDAAPHTHAFADVPETTRGGAGGLRQFKLLIAGNHRPALRNVDEAARRRFNIVPFVLRPKNPDRQLEEKLRAEWPAILRWMIEGCLQWQAGGLRRPDVVTAATEEYFEVQDAVGQWLRECCDLDPSGVFRERPGVLLESFTRWCEINGEPAPDNRRLRGVLERTPGVRYTTTNGYTFVKGIRLLKPEEQRRRKQEAEREDAAGVGGGDPTQV